MLVSSFDRKFVLDGVIESFSEVGIKVIGLLFLRDGVECFGCDFGIDVRSVV